MLYYCLSYFCIDILFFLFYTRNSFLIVDKDMEDANGFHCGDHAGNHHWKNKKINGGNCESCAPVSGFSQNLN